MTTQLNKVMLFAIAAILMNYLKVHAQSTTLSNDYAPTSFLGWGTTSGDLLFKVNNDTKMLLQNNTGNFGLGSINPAAKLHVVNTVSTTPVVNFQTNTGFNAFVVKADGKIAIGSPNGSGSQFDVRAQALPNTYENLFFFTVSDAVVNGDIRDYVGVTNATNTDGQLAPLITACYGSGASAPNLNFRGQTPFANDIGNVPMSRFDAYLLNTSALVVNRPLVQFSNRGNIRVNISANGSIYAGSLPNSSFNAIPVAQLHIVGSGTTSATYTAKFQNFNSADIFAIRNDNKIIYTDGTQGAGKVLTSDANGVASWQTASSSSQWGANGSSIYYNNGKVGVGTSNPDTTLHIAGSVKIVDGTQGADKVLTSDANGLASWQPKGVSSQWINSGSDIYFTNGKVLVGNPALPNFKGLPGTYQLYVQGGILTEKLKAAIATSNDWSDYVFGENYELKSLKEVESFIKENKHLPNVPSAEEVVQEGIDMAKMDAKLLEKIEELTLYLIDQDKKNVEQEKKIKELIEMNTKLHQQIQALQNK